MSTPVIHGIFNMVDKYGLGIGLAIGVFILLYITLKYIMKNSNLILEAYRQDQKNWNLTINNHMSHVTQALDKVADRFEIHEINARDSQGMASEEHKQIVKTLDGLTQVLIKKGGSDGSK